MVGVSVRFHQFADGKDDALVADVHARPGYEFLALLSVLAAERASEIALDPSPRAGGPSHAENYAANG
jgi:hypothetical protein